MIHEDYCTFEQCVKLKELGFDWECNHYYGLDGFLHEETHSYLTNYKNFNESTYLTSAPTFAQAQKWLREVKDVIIFINVKFHKGQVKYSWYIVTDNGERGICDDPEKSIFETYEKALIAGIDRALELLK